jgi:hypothetical protein
MKKSLFGKIVIDGILHYLVKVSYSCGKEVLRTVNGQGMVVKAETLKESRK